MTSYNVKIILSCKYQFFLHMQVFLDLISEKRCAITIFSEVFCQRLPFKYSAADDMEFLLKTHSRFQQFLDTCFQFLIKIPIDLLSIGNVYSSAI